MPSPVDPQVKQFLELLSDTDTAEVVLDFLEIDQERVTCEKNLAEFVKRAWPVLEPGNPLLWNWHLDTLCGYLEALYRKDKYGEERFYEEEGVTYHAAINDAIGVIINVPPGSMKSLIVSVLFPAWIWTDDPSYSFLCGSNESTLATRDALKMRQVIESDWYQKLWGAKCGWIEDFDRVEISKEQGEKTFFSNRQSGFRISQGITAKVTGKRARMILWDDPHDTQKAESDIQRQVILDSWDNAWSSRLNKPDSGPRVIIMQRCHYKDVTGHLLSKTRQNWVRLAIPMYEDDEVTFDAEGDIGRPDLEDPRKSGSGALMFPERFPQKVIDQMEEDLGPYGVAGQLQQRPSPRTGGEFKREWIRYYKNDPRGGNIAIIVDPAGERKKGVKGKRDNTAMGVVMLCEDGNYYLIDGRRERMSLTERTSQLFEWHRKYKPDDTYYESYGKDSDIAHIEDVMERESYRFNIVALGGSMVKEDRIRLLLPLFEKGRIWLPETLYRTDANGKTHDLISDFVEHEYLPFPVAEFDDFFDMLARIRDPDFKLEMPGGKKRIEIPKNIKRRRPSDKGVGL